MFTWVTQELRHIWQRKVINFSVVYVDGFLLLIEQLNANVFLKLKMYAKKINAVLIFFWLGSPWQVFENWGFFSLNLNLKFIHNWFASYVFIVLCNRQKFKWQQVYSPKDTIQLISVAWVYSKLEIEDLKYNFFNIFRGKKIALSRPIL